MKNKQKTVLVLGLMTLSFAGCKNDDDMPMNETININYPAAYVVNGESNSISVINMDTDKVTATIALVDQSMSGGGDMSMEIAWPHHIYLNPAKTQLSIGVPGADLSAGHAGGMEGMMGMFAIVNALDGSITHVMELDMMNHNAVFSPDGTEIWTTQMDDMGKVLIYDASDYSLKSTIDVGADPAEVTFSQNGQVAFVANGGSGTVTAIDPSTKEILATLEVDEDPVGAWPASDGKMYVDNEAGETISVIDVGTLEVEATIDLGFMPGFAAYNAMNEELWVTDPMAGKVHFWNKTDIGWEHGGAFDTGAGAHAIAFSGDEMKAYVTNQEDASISVVNAMDHSIIKKLKVGLKPNGVVIKE
mgnify:CR=1 FL=1